MLYSDVILSKNNKQVPLYFDKTPACSKYNPEKEAESFGCDLKDNDLFVVTGGIGAGYHIKNLLSKHKDIFLIAFEMTDEDLSFTMQLDNIKELNNNPKVILCTFDRLSENIKQHYLPALYGDFHFLTLNSWEKHLTGESEKEKINSSIKETLKDIAADFSVQTHFGKIWQRNILLNLQSISEGCENILTRNFPVEKTAAVIAAGPSLDQSVNQLKEKDYFIISTDTAFRVLVKRGITPDVVVSIDGQAVSKTHFFDCGELNDKDKTIFLFDLCGCEQAARLVKHNGFKTLFFSSNHPLSMLADTYFDLPVINSSAGTVTISALDFALQAGFKNIKLFGADFSYNNGKSYTKGTYLDCNFTNCSTRINNLETQFDALMYRTPVEAEDEESIFSGRLKRRFTSQVLSFYEKGLMEYLKEHDCIVENLTIKCNAPSSVKTTQINCSRNNFNSFMEDLKNTLNETEEKNKCPAVLLPYIAWLRNHTDQTDLKGLVKLAHTSLLRYN